MWADKRLSTEADHTVAFSLTPLDRRQLQYANSTEIILNLLSSRCFHIERTKVNGQKCRGHLIF